jgi:hypothetical protein
MRVSAELPPELWGVLDRWAEMNGVTRPQAVVVAIQRLIDGHIDEIIGAGQLGAIHPHMLAEDREHFRQTVERRGREAAREDAPRDDPMTAHRRITRERGTT